MNNSMSIRINIREEFPYYKKINYWINTTAEEVGAIHYYYTRTTRKLCVLMSKIQSPNTVY